MLPVIKNPTRLQTVNCFKRYGLLRGMVDPTGTLYVWEASEATHNDLDNILGIGMTHRFLMAPEGVTTQYTDAEVIAQVPALRRAYGGDFAVETDLDHDW